MEIIDLLLQWEEMDDKNNSTGNTNSKEATLKQSKPFIVSSMKNSNGIFF